MVTERTDMVVRGVGVIAVLRSTVPRNVAMALRTVLMDASFVDVLVSFTDSAHTLQLKVLILLIVF